MAAPDCEMPKDVVPPGSQTGIYYIPISNLPFNVSWQQIKDYVRQVCEVDHVEIFQKSTSGWVRVKGRENYDAAYRHLNGKEFNGRAIIAEGKNSDRPILVRDLLVCKPTGSSNRPSSGTSNTAVSAVSETPPYASGGPVRHPDFSMLSSPTSTPSSSFSQEGDGYSLSLPSASFMTSPDISFPHAAMPNYDHLSTGFSQSHSMSSYGFAPGQGPVQAPPSFPALPDGPQAMLNLAISYAVQAPYKDYYPPVTTSLTNQMANMTIGGSPTGAVIYTEQRGIQIRDISRRASAEQIRKMLREVTGPEVNLISDIQIPSDKDGNPRGLAFVRFHTADLAKRMERHLHGVEFKGRKLQVRLMKDGEAIYGSSGGSSVASSSKPHRGTKHHHQSSKEDSSRRAERRDRGQPEKASSSSTSSPPSSSSKAPLVVGGMPVAKSTASTSSSSQDESKEGHSKNSSVVIADGSSGRRHSDADRR